MAGKGQKRKDKDRIVLKTGESQRPNGTYDYRWTGRDGKRHVVYAKTLEELREKEAQVANDTFEGIKAEARNVTINEMFDLVWSRKLTREELVDHIKRTYEISSDRIIDMILD